MLSVENNYRLEIQGTYLDYDALIVRAYVPVNHFFPSSKFTTIT